MARHLSLGQIVHRCVVSNKGPQPVTVVETRSPAHDGRHVANKAAPDGLPVSHVTPHALKKPGLFNRWISRQKSPVERPR